MKRRRRRTGCVNSVDEVEESMSVVHKTSSKEKRKEKKKEQNDGENGKFI